MPHCGAKQFIQNPTVWLKTVCKCHTPGQDQNCIDLQYFIASQTCEAPYEGYKCNKLYKLTPKKRLL